MKTIYDEALESLKQHNEVTDMSLEIKALERAKKAEEFIQKLVDDEGTPIWLKVHINNFIEEELK